MLWLRKCGDGTRRDVASDAVRRLVDDGLGPDDDAGVLAWLAAVAAVVMSNDLKLAPKWRPTRVAKSAPPPVDVGADHRQQRWLSALQRGWDRATTRGVDLSDPHTHALKQLCDERAKTALDALDKSREME